VCVCVCVRLRIIRNITATRHKGETDTQIRFGLQSPRSVAHTHDAQKQTPHAQGKEKKKLKQITTTNEQQTHSE